MGSKMKGIAFEVGGVSYKLRFDFNALCALESETGKSIDGVGELLQPVGGGAPRMTDLRLLFWAGLGGEITKAAAGDIMSELGFEGSVNLITTAFVEAFPQIDDGADVGNVVGAAA